jgi:hypothetical protein
MDKWLLPPWISIYETSARAQLPQAGIPPPYLTRFFRHRRHADRTFLGGGVASSTIALEESEMKKTVWSHRAYLINPGLGELHDTQSSVTKGANSGVAWGKSNAWRIRGTATGPRGPGANAG